MEVDIANSQSGTAGQPGLKGIRGPKRIRTSKPKVKTGCTNCKQRRIKCDENRPACTQCVRSRKACFGYPPPPRHRAHEEPKLLPKPESRISPIAPANTTLARAHTSRPLVRPRGQPVAIAQRKLTPPVTPIENALTLYRPSTLPLSSQEGRYFQLFRERTASELSGFFDSTFWTRSVLQGCEHEEAIKHLVVALGALYKTLEKMSESPPGSPSEVLDHSDNAGAHWIVACSHYSLASQGVMSAEPDGQATNRISLMASVLLACFDSFIGHHQNAISHIQNGLKLLESLRSQRRRAFLPSTEEPVEQDLTQMFTRLAIQAKSYDMAFHFPQPYVIRLTPQVSEQPASPSTDGGSPLSTQQSQIPETFESLKEARLAWDVLCEQMMRFVEKMSSRVTMTPMGVLPSALKQYSMGFNQKIEAWAAAFEPILESRMAPAKSSQEKTGIAVLKMNQIMGKILLIMTFSDTEMSFDPFLSFFKEIVNLAMEVIGDEERRAAAKRCPDPYFCQHYPAQSDMFQGQYTARHIKPSFSADLGIVPPLFVVATKCRDALTRRRAIQLLKSSSRREGMWDSELAARIGTWIMTIEEEDDGHDDFFRPSTSSTMESPGARSMGSPAFGDDIPLGPGGNARWGKQRESVSNSSPLYANEKRTIPEEKRVMVRSVEFDLRDRVAHIRCGTRGLIPGTLDLKTKSTTIWW